MTSQNTSPTIGITSVTNIDPVNKTVTLTYTNGTNAPANNNGNVREVEGQGACQTTYLSQSPGWTVCGFVVKPGTTVPSDMSIQNAVLIQDAATNTTQESLSFYLQVMDSNGNIYTSQDPAETNEP